MATTATPAVLEVVNAQVARRLQQRGVVLDLLPGEGDDDLRARVETALCALFRDERDPESFDTLYRVGGPSLLRWIELLARGLRLDAHEVLQDAFVNMYRYVANFRDEAPRSFAVWSRTIAGNLVRRARAARRGMSLEALMEVRAEPRDPHAGPVQVTVEDEERERLAQAWIIVLSRWLEAYEALSPRERRLMDLVEVRGLSYAAAAENMGLGLSNVKMILFRARTRMRQRIGCEFEQAVRRAG